MDIYITDDRVKMIETGKDIFAQKKEIYNSKMVNTIYHSIKNIYPKATKEETEEFFYISLYDYWVYGNNINEEFFYKFYQKKHKEKDSYITFRNRFLYIWHLNNKNDAHILNNKYETYRRLKKYYKRDMIKISSHSDYAEFERFVETHPVFVVKPESLALAVGVHKDSIYNYSSKKTLFQNLLLEIERIKDKTTWGKKNTSLVLEELIEQDARMGSMHPHSVNIIRTTTIKVDGKIYFYCPWVKFGASGGFVASAGCGGYSAGIDEESGIIWSDGYRENGEVVKTHPDTGIPFKGFQIPKWKDAVALTYELANTMPEFGYVGWDLALTPKGWCVIEGNFAGEFIWQMWYERGMKEEFEKLINWKPDQDFWWK